MELKPEEIKVETVNISRGGFSPAKDWGIRITHLPSGIQAESLDPTKRAHANKELAYKKLKDVLDTVEQGILQHKPTINLTHKEACELIGSTILKVFKDHGIQVADIPRWPGSETIATRVVNALDSVVNYMERKPQRGDRCEIISGFSVGSRGTVEFVQPNGHVWILRDMASSSTKHSAEELKLL